MKATFIKTLALSLLAVVTLGLSACKGDDTPNVPPTPSPSTSGEIARVTIKLSMGHLHGKQDFHFVPSSGKYDLRNIYDSQEFTFVKNGDTWSLAPGSPYSDLIAFQLFAWDPKVYSSIAPDYGAVIELYDAEGKLLNDQYTSEELRSQYQFFFYPTEATDFDGKPIAVNAADPTSILRYVYCDTNVWNQSASKSPTDNAGKKLYYFLPETEPIGIKGYYQFPETGHFLLNIDLWHSPKGKLEEGKASPFYAPNATVKSGKQLLHLSLPMNIYASKDFQDEVVSYMDADYDRRVDAAPDNEKEKVKPEPYPFEKLSDENKVYALRLVKLLGAKDWESVSLDFFRYYKSYKHNNDPEGYF